MKFNVFLIYFIYLKIYKNSKSLKLICQKKECTTAHLSTNMCYD